ncbi:phage regulatory CII family protein [Ramlibacter sp.]|uniref:phage regulatory CII family protein n=1 Tax=Ramlibacter sp. TaxID=1917967 RepID=UPI003D138372
MNPLHAFRDVVYAFGVQELAAELGYREGTLYNKADADAESHHQPTLRDVINVTRATGDTRILESLDRLFDRAGFDLPPQSVCSDEHLLEILCRVGSENGQLHEAVRRALGARRFTVDDLQKVRAEAFDLVSEVMAFLARLESLLDD